MRRRRGRREKETFDINLWHPRTKTGREVKEGRVTDIGQVLRSGQRLMETEIVNALVPNMDEEILGVSLVQRMHKSGRRIRYRIVGVVGNKDGIVGLGVASAREIGPAIRKAMDAAKLNIIEVARGCGSWECGCGRNHSVPLEISGKSGSVSVTLKPAPRGLGLSAAGVPKTILGLAGVKDVWTSTSGETRTTLNFATAVFNTLKETTRVMLPENVKKNVTVGKAGESSGQVSGS